MRRTLGKPILLSKSLSKLSQQELYSQVLLPLWQNGTICIKQQSLSSQDLVTLSQQIGRPVHLPKAFGFNNLDSTYPSIVRVGNINKDGSIRQNIKDAEYWHHDGDFWAYPQNQIINILHTQVTPKTGGKTGFIDMISPLKEGLFSQETQEKLRNSEILVKTTEITDFKNAPKEDQMPDQVHSVVKWHSINGEECLYLPFGPEGLQDINSKKSWVECEDVIERIANGGYLYEHEWEEGDVLIWDNMSVMHRSMGGYGNHPRLLLRAQARYHERTREEFYNIENSFYQEQQQQNEENQFQQNQI